MAHHWPAPISLPVTGECLERSAIRRGSLAEDSIVRRAWRGLDSQRLADVVDEEMVVHPGMLARCSGSCEHRLDLKSTLRSTYISRGNA